MQTNFIYNYNFLRTIAFHSVVRGSRRGRFIFNRENNLFLINLFLFI